MTKLAAVVFIALAAANTVTEVFGRYESQVAEKWGFVK